jgi:hypothetical protein
LPNPQGRATRRTQISLRLIDACEFSALTKFGGKRTEENLAVASAVAAAIPAAPATVATAPAATPASTAATAVSAAIATASATTAATAFSLRASLIHYQRAAKKVFAVEGCNRLLRCAVVMNLGETEAARLSCETIAEQREGIGLYADFSKQRLHLLFCRFK